MLKSGLFPAVRPAVSPHTHTPESSASHHFLRRFLRFLRTTDNAIFTHRATFTRQSNLLHKNSGSGQLRHITLFAFTPRTKNETPFLTPRFQPGNRPRTNRQKSKLFFSLNWHTCFATWGNFVYFVRFKSQSVLKIREGEKNVKDGTTPSLFDKYFCAELVTQEWLSWTWNTLPDVLI